jgi:hypothetical protein
VNAPVDVVLLFDVEDVYSPPEAGTDDSIREIADILTEEGLTGTFLFIGDRALHLRERGRADVIAAVSRHEVGLHTRSARHPCAPEYAAGRSWDEGVEETVRHEGEGIAIIMEVFGCPACALSAHNVFSSPQAHHAAARLGLPYLYAFAAAPPLHGPSWYAGAWCLPWLGPEEGRLARSYGPEFDDVYPDTPAFEARLREFDAFLERRRQEGHRLLSLMLYHPQRLRLVDYVDHFWAPNGANIPRERWGGQGEPRRYSAAQVATARDNFRRLARRIRHDSRLNPITVAAAAARHGRQPSAITQSELLTAAADVVCGGGPQLNARFSPAEILAGMIGAVAVHAETGALPSALPRRDVLGPTENPIIEPEIRRADWSLVAAWAAEAGRFLARTGRLPANLGAVGERIGLNHLHVGLAEGLGAISAGRAPGTIAFRRTPRCPPAAEGIGRRFLEISDGELVDPDLDIDGLYRHGRLQAWTLKPALAPEAPLS